MHQRRLWTDQAPVQREMINHITPDGFWKEVDGSLDIPYMDIPALHMVGYYDFLSSPLAGLFPGWRAGYKLARLGDDLITRIPLLQRAGSNFEIVASLPPRAANA